jgi:hypothetical protein
MRPLRSVLYHDSFRQAYGFERDIAFRDLVFRLTPYRVPPGEQALPSRVFITAEPGIGAALVSYLFRWRVPARASLAEWPSDSAFEDRPRRLYVLESTETPERITELLRALPGVHVFEPVAGGAGVELGFRHPISLESCQSIFDEESLCLFRGDGFVVVVSPLPPFAPVRSLVRTELTLEEATAPKRGGPVDQDLTLSLPLRLAPSHDPWRNVVATVVPAEQRAWLARLLYALPPKTLASLRMAIGADRIYLIDPSGIEGVPLGAFHCEAASKIYVPAGSTLVPAVAPAVLEELVADRGDAHVFFVPDGPPKMVPAAAFGPISRMALREVAATTVHADAPQDEEPPLPMLQYEEPRRFPLWGVPGKETERKGE